MKKKFIKIIFALSLVLVILFSLAACTSDNQDLLDRLSKLETEQAALNVKIAALETANTTYKNQLDALIASHAADIETLNVKIAALETANKTLLDNLTAMHAADLENLNVKITALESANATFVDQITALTTRDNELEGSITDLQTELDTLTNSVANATNIERTVVSFEGFQEYTHPIVRTVYVKVHLPELSQTTQNVQIGCTLGHDDYSFNYQLVTFNTTLLVNGVPSKNFNISVTQAKSKEHTLDQTFNTHIKYDKEASNTYTVTWSEIVLYRFV